MSLTFVPLYNPTIYLRMNNWEDNERHEILDTEDDDGEAGLHPGPGPGLNTHGVASPRQVNGLNGLKEQDW